MAVRQGVGILIIRIQPDFSTRRSVKGGYLRPDLAGLVPITHMRLESGGLRLADGVRAKLSYKSNRY